MLLAYSRLFIIAIPCFTKAYYLNKYVHAPYVAELYNMNVRALMPALSLLTRAGLLRSRVGGKEPGFIFSRDPQTITLLEVMSALEGNGQFDCCADIMHGVRCENTNKNGCIDKHKCLMYNLFNDINTRTKARLERINLKHYSEQTHNALKIMNRIF